MISKNLVSDRVNHLINCEGRLQRSSFHKWKPLSATIVHLHPLLSWEGKDVVIGMLQSLSMKEYPDTMFDCFGLTIVDECHHRVAMRIPVFSSWKCFLPFLLEPKNKTYDAHRPLTPPPHVDQPQDSSTSYWYDEWTDS